MKPSRELARPEPEVVAIAKAIDAPPPSYNYGVDPNADNEVHLLDYWRSIRKRLWMVVGVVALITMLAVVYVARKPDFYQRRACKLTSKTLAESPARFGRCMVHPTVRSTSTRNSKFSAVPV